MTLSSANITDKGIKILEDIFELYRVSTLKKHKISFDIGVFDFCDGVDFYLDEYLLLIKFDDEQLKGFKEMVKDNYDRNRIHYAENKKLTLTEIKLKNKGEENMKKKLNIVRVLAQTFVFICGIGSLIYTYKEYKDKM